MAEPEDPQLDETPPAPEPAAPPTAWDAPDIEDDAVGFCTPASLTAASRAAPLAPVQAAPELKPDPLVEPEVRTAPDDPLAAPLIAPRADELPRATRPFARPRPKPEDGVTSRPETRLALIIYGCLIAAVVTFGASAVVALYLAWTGRGGATGAARSHLLYQLRTSLIATLAGAVGVLTLPVGLGVFVLTATVIWVVVRAAAGLIRLIHNKPIPDPRTWSLP